MIQELMGDIGRKNTSAGSRDQLTSPGDDLSVLVSRHLNASHFQPSMVDNSSPDYKNLFQHQGERWKQEEERRKHAEDEGRRERERREQAELQRNKIEERTRRTTFLEFPHHCTTYSDVT